MIFNCDHDLEVIMVDLCAMHIILLQQTFDQSLMKILTGGKGDMKRT